MTENIPELELDVRRAIYQTIQKSPGLHFREVQRRTGQVTGSLQYHLDYLKKHELITEQKDRDYSRFFVKGDLTEEEKHLLSFLRQSIVRQIIMFLIEKPKSKHGTITKAVGRSPATVSWHLKRLAEAGLLEAKKKGRITLFSLIDPDLAVTLLITYKESFLDKLVDSFIESWVS